MRLTTCNEETSILEVELAAAVKQGSVANIHIMEMEENYYVVAELKYTPNKVWYLTTRRDRNAPKIFKDLNRLNKHLKTDYKTDTVTIFRNQELPPK
jgi:hypothetical protein